MPGTAPEHAADAAAAWAALLAGPGRLAGWGRCWGEGRATTCVSPLQGSYPGPVWQHRVAPVGDACRWRRTPGQGRAGSIVDMQASGYRRAGASRQHQRAAEAAIAGAHRPGWWPFAAIAISLGGSHHWAPDDSQGRKDLLPPSLATPVKLEDELCRRVCRYLCLCCLHCAMQAARLGLLQQLPIVFLDKGIPVNVAVLVKCLR